MFYHCCDFYFFSQNESLQIIHIIRNLVFTFQQNMVSSKFLCPVLSLNTFKFHSEQTKIIFKPAFCQSIQKSYKMKETTRKKLFLHEVFQIRFQNLISLMVCEMWGCVYNEHGQEIACFSMPLQMKQIRYKIGCQ